LGLTAEDVLGTHLLQRQKAIYVFIYIPLQRTFITKGLEGFSTRTDTSLSNIPKGKNSVPNMKCKRFLYSTCITGKKKDLLYVCVFGYKDFDQFRQNEACRPEMNAKWISNIHMFIIFLIRFMQVCLLS
jgi:hypothetical protein